MPEKTIVDDFISVQSLPSKIKDNGLYEITQSNPNSYTHYFFKYPCKFIPEIPRWAIKTFIPSENAKIFDPFVGSGTTLLEGILNGKESFGVEIDELAKLLVRVKTTQFISDELVLAKKIFNDFIVQVRGNKIEPTVAELFNINHWFPENHIYVLGKMRTLIETIENQKIKDFFKVCFASIIRRSSFADDVSPKPYVSSRIKKIPSDPLTVFIDVFNKYISSIEELSNLRLNANAHIIGNDALSIKSNIKMDLIVTSPPYINAFDYGRTLRLENIWLGFLSEEELREKKKDYIGTEKIRANEESKDLSILTESNTLQEAFHKISKVDEKRAFIVKKFFQDMKIAIRESGKLLKRNGYYCIVIGNSNIRKTEVESWKILQEIAEKNGYQKFVKFGYIIKNPYLRIPRGGKGGKISIDYVLVLQKK